MSTTENKEGSWTYTWCVGTKISINLNQFRINGKFCDIDIISGETKVKAHRVVLAASCEYFDAMFNVGLEESQKGRVVLPSVPPGILPMIIDFIYTGEIIIDKGTVQHLLIAADMLQLRELVVGCGEFLKRELHPSNALGIFRFAKTHNCTELAEEALALAQANWNDVANGEELLDLPLQELITLISSEQLKVNEAQVLYPALKWLEHDPVNRRCHCFEVLRHVRLPVISPQILDDTLKTVQDPSIAVALKILRVDMKLNKGALVATEPRSARRLLILAGGQKENPPLSSVLKFDLHKRKWEELAPMGKRRIESGVATLGERVYVVGGKLKEHIKYVGMELNNGEVYDPQLDKWSNIKRMNEARREFGLTGWNGNLVAFGGTIALFHSSRVRSSSSSIEVYNPVSDVWIIAGRMPVSRFGMGVVTYGGLIYIVGGRTDTQQHTRDLLCYQPGARIWTVLTSMRHARYQAAAVVLGEHLYVIGGNANGPASVERYSFDKDEWEEVTAPKMYVRCAAGAVEGVLVVVGGNRYSDDCAIAASVEVYEPASGTWSRVMRRDTGL